VLLVHAVVASLVPAAGHRSRLAVEPTSRPPRCSTPPACCQLWPEIEALCSGSVRARSSVFARASGHRNQHGGRLGDGPTARRRDALQRPARARPSSSAGREGAACRKISVCFVFVSLFGQKTLHHRSLCVPLAQQCDGDVTFESSRGDWSRGGRRTTIWLSTIISAFSRVSFEFLSRVYVGAHGPRARRRPASRDADGRATPLAGFPVLGIPR